MAPLLKAGFVPALSFVRATLRVRWHLHDSPRMRESGRSSSSASARSSADVEGGRRSAGHSRDDIGELEQGPDEPIVSAWPRILQFLAHDPRMAPTPRGEQNGPRYSSTGTVGVTEEDDGKNSRTPIGWIAPIRHVRNVRLPGSLLTIESAFRMMAPDRIKTQVAV
jgi:hypothetical protein